MGNLEGSHLLGTLERQKKEGSGNKASLSMGGLSGEPGGGLLYLGPWRICKGRLWKQASLSIGAQLVNQEGGSTGDFQRRTKAGSRDM